MPTASYSAATRTLTISGEPVADVLTVRRDAVGNILINNGAVPIAGGPATVANTDLIAMFGFDENDNLTLDETEGPLPPVNASGGNGNDFILAGSGADTLNGDAGVDFLLGGGGIDNLFGGTENDTLLGGAGNDNLSGDAGNDRMVWNEGDGTDMMEGGAGSDVAEVNGSTDGETFAVTANGTRVRFDRLTQTPFALDIGTTESLIVNGGDGDDNFSATGNLAALIALSFNGGAGNDTIRGGNGADVLIGGNDDDFIDGQQGADAAFLGNGNDTFQWDPGDGNDTIEGQAGLDTLAFNGSGASETFDLTSNGNRLLFTRDIGAVVMDMDDLEQVVVNALFGIDFVTVTDLGGTDLTALTVNLAGTIGGTVGDGAVDRVTVNGSLGVDDIVISGGGGSYTVVGLSTSVTVNQSEAGDQLILEAGSGDDDVDAGLLAGGVVSLVINGGIGSDSLHGSAGSDTLFGGNDDDTIDGNGGADDANLGAGNDTFVWDPGDGSDFVEGAADADTLQFNTSGGTEVINIFANAGRALVLRNVGGVLVDTNDVETITVTASGGSDHIVIGDLTGTDVTHVIVGAPAAGAGSPASPPAAAKTAADAPLVASADTPPAEEQAGDSPGAGEGGEEAADAGDDDVFSFATPLGGSILQVPDFTSGSDSIHLARAIFAELGHGGLPADAFVVGSAARSEDQRIVYDQATGALFYDADGEDAGAAIQFAQLEAGTILAASDFVVI